METPPTDNPFTRCKVGGRREAIKKRLFDTFSLLLCIWFCCGHDELGEGAFGSDLGRLSRGLGGELGGGFVGELSDEASGSYLRGLGIEHGTESERASSRRRHSGGVTRAEAGRRGADRTGGTRRNSVGGSGVDEALILEAHAARATG
jgi:hypothetical protein